MAKYRSEGVRARGLASGSLSHTVQEFSRTASTLSKLSLCKRPPGTPEMEGVPELEGARTGGCQNWRVPELEGARTGGCQNWRVPELEGARTGGCQNWRVPVLAEGANSGAR